MPRDKTFQHAAQRPERDFYSIWETQNGKREYYKTTLAELARYEALYGVSSGRWSYTAHEADRVVE